MALGSTQPLVKMNTRNIPGCKGGQCVRLTTYHHTVPLSRNLGALTSQKPLGLLRLVTGQILPYNPDRLCGPCSLLCSGYWVIFLTGVKRPGMKMTTRLHIMLTSWMSGTFLPVHSVQTLKLNSFSHACYMTNSYNPRFNHCNTGT